MSVGKVDLLLTGGSVVNVFNQSVEKTDVAIKNGRIAGLGSYDADKVVDLAGGIVCPGFIDSHIHIESSMLTPARFAAAVAPHGTAAVVADPHEIVNVYGLAGFEYMYKAAQGSPAEIFYTVPSCVPATPDDENGGELTAEEVAGLMSLPRVVGLGEVMDTARAIRGDKKITAEIAAAVKYDKRVDGHAPGLRGKRLDAYLGAGPQTDHECGDIDEALEKIAKGCRIQIREGTAAKNLAALIMLLDEPYYRLVMLASDDRHAGDLIEGHMDEIIRRAVRLGADPLKTVTAATLNPALFYGLKGYGAVAPGYRADLAVVDDLSSFNVVAVYKQGIPIANDGALISAPAGPSCELPARFNIGPLNENSFSGAPAVPAIELIPGQITTKAALAGDTVGLAVIERYRGRGHIGLGRLKGYGLKGGAIASTISHDAHNVVVAGTDNASMLRAVRALESCGGGICVAAENSVFTLPLPIGGLMCDAAAGEVAARLDELKGIAYLLGVNTNVDPFMSLSFLSLPVIPALRLTTKGLIEIG